MLVMYTGWGCTSKLMMKSLVASPGGVTVSSSGLPAASVMPGYCSSVVCATNVYCPAGKPGANVRLMCPL